MTVGFSFDDKPTVNSRDELVMVSFGKGHRERGKPAELHADREARGKGAKGLLRVYSATEP